MRDVGPISPSSGGDPTLGGDVTGLGSANTVAKIGGNALNSAGTRTALGLGTAATSASTAFVSSAANAVTATNLAVGFIYPKYTVGKNGIGDFTVTGVRAGDVISCVTLLGNPAAGDNTITTQFTALIASDNTIHQLVVTDYSMSGLLFLIVAKGGGA